MLEVDVSNRVLRLTLNRPEKRNALTLDLCGALLTAIEKAQTDETIGAILLAGNGPAFCSGMDLEEAQAADQEKLADVHDRLFTSIQRAGKPIFAAVDGPALAGGAGLAANAHVVFASPRAKFGLTEIRIGLWPVLVFRSVALAIGERRALEWSITGRLVSASEALDAGLVTEVAEDPLYAAAMQARTVANYSADILREGLAYTRQIRGLTWGEGGALGRNLRHRLSGYPAFQEGLRAFQQKREPRWHED